jgi:hypothetical protein
MAAAVQGFHFGRMRPFAAQIAPKNPFAFYPGGLIHRMTQFFIARLPSKCLNCLKLEVPKGTESLRFAFFIKMTEFLNFKHFSSL